MLGKRRRPPPNIPAYGILIGRMIFIGGLVMALVGLGFFVMLGIAAGSLLALGLFGLIGVAGSGLSYLAMRDLTGLPIEQTAIIIDKSFHTQGDNPNYEFKFTLTNSKREISYNVTKQDWDKFSLKEQVILRYSTFFKLLIDIRSL